MQRRDFILSLPMALAVPTAAQPEPPAPERPIEQTLIMQLWSLQDVCEEAILQTCHGCERTVEQRGCCMECEDLDALHWQIRNFRTLFVSGIVCFPELRERYRLEREGRS
jgi:hypothetical protein